jgi:hypothetical protein
MFDIHPISKSSSFFREVETGFAKPVKVSLISCLIVVRAIANIFIFAYAELLVSSKKLASFFKSTRVTSKKSTALAKPLIS